MKKTFLSHVRPVKSTLLTVGILAILFSACNKNNDVNGNPSAAGLMAVNLANTAGGVQFVLSGNALNSSPIAYGNFTGGYLNIFPGDRKLESRDFGGGSLLDSASTNFTVGKYYSLFLIQNGTNYKNILVHDDIDSLSASSGQAYIRYINAINDPSSPNVNIVADSGAVWNGSATLGSVSLFKPVKPGSLNIRASNEGAINKNRSIDVEARKIYTVLLMGKPSSSNAADSVQIKFIVNGQIQ